MCRFLHTGFPEMDLVFSGCSFILIPPRWATNTPNHRMWCWKSGKDWDICFNHWKKSCPESCATEAGAQLSWLEGQSANSGDKGLTGPRMATVAWELLPGSPEWAGTCGGGRWGLKGRVWDGIKVYLCQRNSHHDIKDNKPHIPSSQLLLSPPFLFLFLSILPQ